MDRYKPPQDPWVSHSLHLTRPTATHPWAPPVDGPAPHSDKLGTQELDDCSTPTTHSRRHSIACGSLHLGGEPVEPLIERFTTGLRLDVSPSRQDPIGAHLSRSPRDLDPYGPWGESKGFMSAMVMPTYSLPPPSPSDSTSPESYLSDLQPAPAPGTSAHSSLRGLSPPTTNGFSPPNPNGFASSNPNGYAPSKFDGFAPPALDGFAPPTLDGFSPPTLNGFSERTREAAARLPPHRADTHTFARVERQSSLGSSAGGLGLRMETAGPFAPRIDSGFDSHAFDPRPNAPGSLGQFGPRTELPGSFGEPSLGQTYARIDTSPSAFSRDSQAFRRQSADTQAYLRRESADAYSRRESADAYPRRESLADSAEAHPLPRRESSHRTDTSPVAYARRESRDGHASHAAQASRSPRAQSRPDKQAFSPQQFSPTRVSPTQTSPLSPSQPFSSPDTVFWPASTAPPVYFAPKSKSYRDSALQGAKPKEARNTQVGRLMTSPGRAQEPSLGNVPDSSLGFGVPLGQVPADARFYSVEFKQRTELYFSVGAGADSYTPGTYVIVEADRGRDMGRVVAVVGREAAAGLKTLRRLFRAARPAEVATIAQRLQDEEHALTVLRQKLPLYGINMKVETAEFQFDRQRLTYYYEAERRIDFRDLVKDLFRVYKARIWMCCVNDAERTSHRA